MVRLANRLYKFTVNLVKVTKNIPLFSCKKSKHTYTQRQHITVLGLMKYLRTDYRGVIEILDLMPEVRAARLVKVTHVVVTRHTIARPTMSSCTRRSVHRASFRSTSEGERRFTVTIGNACSGVSLRMSITGEAS